MMQSDEIERDGGARAHDERAAPDASVIESGPEAAAHGAPDRPSRAERISRLIRRRTGTVAAAVAVVAFAAGVYGAYHLAAPRPDRRIILRQATETEQMSDYTQVAGAGGILILLRNDSTVPVEVIDVAFARTSAAPPLYIAPELVVPGGEANLYVQTPARCGSAGLSRDPNPPPVTLSVSARLPGGDLQFVPVVVTGTMASAIQACHEQGNL